MAREDMKKIIAKAKENEKFMEDVLCNPKETLKNYNLTTKEIHFFEMADRKTIEGLKDSCFELA